MIFFNFISVPTFSFIFITALCVCAHVFLVRQPQMWWCTCEFYMNERCHKMYCCAFHCPKIDIHVCQFLRCLKMTWRSHVMNVSEGGPHTNLSQEIIGMVLVDLKKMTCLPWFLCFKKMHLADDMSKVFFQFHYSHVIWELYNVPIVHSDSVPRHCSAVETNKDVRKRVQTWNKP